MDRFQIQKNKPGPQKDFDILVIGSGPAGASIAYYLAKKNFSVLLVEKKKNIDMPVRCAEFVPANIASLFDFKIYGINNQTDTLHTYVSGGFGCRFNLAACTPAPGFMLDRHIFVENITERFKKSGGILLKGTKVAELTSKNIINNRNFSNNYIPGQYFEALLSGAGTSHKVCGKQKIKSRIVVFAGGPVLPAGITEKRYEVKNTKVKEGKDTGIFSLYNSMGLGHEMKFIYALNQNIPVTLKDTKINRIFFAPYIYGGYGWLFPKTSSINIGIGMATPHGIKQSLEKFKNHLYDSEVLNLIIKDYASKYCEIFKNATHATAGIAPVSGIIPVPATKEGLVIIGDAAGMCNPVTGAGIYNAVYSAYIAAEKISLSIEKNDRSILSEIKDSYNDSFLKSIGRAVKKREYMLDNWQSSSVSFDEMIRKSWIAFRDYWK